MTLEKLAGSHRFVMIKRAGEIVGYYDEDYQWEPKDLAKVDLTGVTKITYGQDLRGKSEPITISKPGEILLWIAAYKNHTQYARGHSLFVPLGEGAGFKYSREEIEYGGAFLNKMGIRYYVGEKLVLTVKGYFQENDAIDMRTKNEALHMLVKAKFAKKKEVKTPNSVEPVKEVDPFADEPETEE